MISLGGKINVFKLEAKNTKLEIGFGSKMKFLQKKNPEVVNLLSNSDWRDDEDNVDNEDDGNDEVNGYNNDNNDNNNDDNDDDGYNEVYDNDDDDNNG